MQSGKVNVGGCGPRIWRTIKTCDLCLARDKKAVEELAGVRRESELARRGVLTVYTLVETFPGQANVKYIYRTIDKVI